MSDVLLQATYAGALQCSLLGGRVLHADQLNDAPQQSAALTATSRQGIIAVHHAAGHQLVVRQPLANLARLAASVADRVKHYRLPMLTASSRACKVEQCARSSVGLCLGLACTCCRLVTNGSAATSRLW
jgi:hypothetical protein